MDAVVACDPEVARECIEHVGLPAQRVSMIPAFAPPDAGCAPSLAGYICDYTGAHRLLLSAVGRIGKRRASQGLYGIDMMIELVRRLRPEHPDIGLVLCVGGGPPDQVREAVETSKRCIGDHLLMVGEPLDDVTRLFRSSQLFVRPTNTDGDAVSIREALHVGVPVVASDAVSRPEPCILFRSRDMDDFEKQMRAALADLPALQAQVAACEMPDNAAEILDTYTHLLRSEATDPARDS